MHAKMPNANIPMGKFGKASGASNLPPSGLGQRASINFYGQKQ